MLSYLGKGVIIGILNWLLEISFFFSFIIIIFSLQKQIWLPVLMVSILSQQIFNNIINRVVPWPKIPEEMSYEAYHLINK